GSLACELGHGHLAGELAGSLAPLDRELIDEALHQLEVRGDLRLDPRRIRRVMLLELGEEWMIFEPRPQRRRTLDRDLALLANDLDVSGRQHRRGIEER